MAQVLIRNLDDAVVERHRQRAKARGVSLEQELRELITRGARTSRAEKLAVIERFMAMPQEVPSSQRTPGWELIREDRDGR